MLYQVLAHSNFLDLSLVLRHKGSIKKATVKNDINDKINIKVFK